MSGQFKQASLDRYEELVLLIYRLSPYVVVNKGTTLGLSLDCYHGYTATIVFIGVVPYRDHTS